MSEPSGTTASKSTIIIGMITFVIGMVPLLAAVGVLPRGHDAPDEAPPWIGWLIGMMFGSAGIVVIIKGIVGSADDESGSLPLRAPRLLRVVYDLLAAIIVCSLAALFSWIAFGPGARHFSVSTGGLSIPTSGVGDTMGRVAFSIGSVLIWGFAIVMVVMTVCRWWRLRQ